MRIHSIVVVKNEADIIEHCLREALNWSDRIYVYDNGSTDGTWQIVRSMQGERLIPFKQDDRPFSNALRAELFAEYRAQSRDGDWWCRLDAHEVYIDDPRDFLSSVRHNRDVVWGLFVQYYLTPEDLVRIDFSQPCANVLPLLRYYTADYTETRFFRYRAGLQWPKEAAWPIHLGKVEERLIRFKHYPYRSPTQMQRRLDDRRDAYVRGYRRTEWGTQKTWRDKIRLRTGLYEDTRDGTFRVDAAVLRSHIPAMPRRLIQAVMHGLKLWP